MKRIDQSKKAKEEFKSPILPLLKRDEKISKNSLKSRLNTDERSVRRMISDVSMHYAVIAHSKAKGYRLAQQIDKLNIAELEIEINEVKLSLSELRSRVMHLKAKMKPLIAYLKIAKRKRDKLLKNTRQNLRTLAAIPNEVM